MWSEDELKSIRTNWNLCLSGPPGPHLARRLKLKEGSSLPTHSFGLELYLPGITVPGAIPRP